MKMVGWTEQNFLFGSQGDDHSRDTGMVGPNIGRLLYDLLDAARARRGWRELGYITASR